MLKATRSGGQLYENTWKPAGTSNWRCPELFSDVHYWTSCRWTRCRPQLSHVSLLGIYPRQSNFHNAAALVIAIREFQRAAMPFCYLPREYEANSAASGFGRIERNESVAGIH